jgi:hypothetical protein
MPIYNVDEYNDDVQQKLSKTLQPQPLLLPTDCGTSNYPRVIHNETTWKLLQNIYHENNGGGKKSYHHRIHARHRYLYTYSGLYPKNAIEVRNDVLNRGRTLYASQDIPKDTIVWLSVHSSFSNDVEDGEDIENYNSFGQGGQANKAYFCSLEEVTSFLQRLSPYPNIQCDILLWAYATKFEGGSVCVECDLDEASYMNHGEHPHLININSDSIAARDIQKGEELLMNYNDFIAHKSLDWWDELRNTAWKEEEQEECTTNDDENETVGGGDAMNEYVKYGKPKSTTTTASSSGAGAAAFGGGGGGVDAASITIGGGGGGGGNKKIYSFFETTGASLTTTSIFITLFLVKKGFSIVQQQQQRRRRRRR